MSTIKTTEAPPAAARATDAVRHTVKPGETLGIIARNYGVRQGDIAVVTNISDPAKIRAGMELIIPGLRGNGTKAGKTGAKAPSTDASTIAEPRPAAIDVPPESAVTPPPPVPVIRIDDAPAAPAPKP